MTVAGVTAILTVLLGALGAYAFPASASGDGRMGMLTLLLVQMFPLFLAFVAIYLIMLRVSDVFPHIGLNTRSGLILVYLGGVLGVNAWLMKRASSTRFPTSSTSPRGGRRDGGPDLLDHHPAAGRPGARGDRPALVHRDAERVRPREHPAPVAGQVHALGRAVHLRFARVREQWGPFCAGVVLMAVPVVILFLFLQRFIVQGMTGGVKG